MLKPILLEFLGFMRSNQNEWEPLVPSIGYAINYSPTYIGSKVLHPSNIIIKDESISRKHACLFFVGQDWYLEDTGSDNGTWLLSNGARTRLVEPAMIQQGFQALLGAVVVSFHTDLGF